MKEKRLSKSEWKQLEKDLLRERKPVWPRLKAKERKEVLDFSDGYRSFLSTTKTERETVNFIRRTCEKKGFVPVSRISSDNKKILWTYKNKLAALAILGKKTISQGVRIIASHIDSPRLDLKQNPLYEELDMAYLKTHYYGGIKKFHWVARPLAIHGTVLRDNGESVRIVIGEDGADPVLTINDLLPHLAAKVQADKKLKEAIPAEKLNVLVGGIHLPGPDEAKEAVKLRILALLNERFGIKEEDLISAELEIVPAGPAREVGFDKAFVGRYGQDDRICAYASLQAIISLQEVEDTVIALFLDKEEIGSDGNTGAKSRFLELILYDLFRCQGIVPEADSLVRALMGSRAISADVTAGIDPDYQEVHEKRNDARIGYGICLTKYTGARGKYSANDAHAEYVNWIRRIWNGFGVMWQAGELGKVDEGGGGTVAKYMARHGMDTIDAGPPLLSMHSPFEICHKVDLFMSYKAYQAFYQCEER